MSATVGRVNPFRTRPGEPAWIPPPGMDEDPEIQGPPTPRATMPEPALERTRRARSEVRAVEELLLPGATASELAPALAERALRRLEQGLQDYDPRVSFEAARVLVTAASRVREIKPADGTAPGAGDVDPEARRAAMIAALGSDEAVALVVELAFMEGSAVRVALECAGWAKGEPGA